MTLEKIGLLMAGAHEKEDRVRLILEKRSDRSEFFAHRVAVHGVVLTLIVGGHHFCLAWLNPLDALYVYFVEPLTQVWSLEQLVVKATPLVLIGVGLAVCYLANVWNIGAEGQLHGGCHCWQHCTGVVSRLAGPLDTCCHAGDGHLGGALFGLIPGLLKTRFNANEILTSLMLVYVAQLLLDWLVRGPWRDPKGFNFPETKSFADWQLLPTFGGTIHLGAALRAAGVRGVGVHDGTDAQGL